MKNSWKRLDFMHKQTNYDPSLWVWGSRFRDILRKRAFPSAPRFGATLIINHFLLQFCRRPFFINIFFPSTFFSSFFTHACHNLWSLLRNDARALFRMSLLFYLTFNFLFHYPGQIKLDSPFLDIVIEGSAIYMIRNDL